MSTNVPGGETTTLTIKGTIWQPVQVTPASVAFGRITADQADKGLVKKMTIVNNIDGAMTLTDVASTNPIFKAEVTVLEAGKKYELVVTLQPPLTSGNNTGKITMNTGLAETASLEIPAYAYVSSPVDVTPAALTLPENRTADLQRQFYVRSNTNQPVVLTDLQASNPELKLALADIRGQLTYRLTVNIPASYKPSASGDTISFKTSNPAVPSIVIPITGRAAGQAVPLPQKLDATRRNIGASVPATIGSSANPPAAASAGQVEAPAPSGTTPSDKAPTKAKTLPKVGSESKAEPSGPKAVKNEQAGSKQSMIQKSSASKAITTKITRHDVTKRADAEKKDAED